MHLLNCLTSINVTGQIHAYNRFSKHDCFCYKYLAVGVTDKLYLGFYCFNVWNKQVSQLTKLTNIVITTINHKTTFNMEACDRVVFLCIHVPM